MTVDPDDGILERGTTMYPVLGLLGGIGTSELLVILVVFLLLFGPRKLPEIARNLGKAMRGIRDAANQIKQEIRLEDLDPGIRPSDFSIDIKPGKKAEKHPSQPKSPPTDGSSGEKPS